MAKKFIGEKYDGEFHTNPDGKGEYAGYTTDAGQFIIRKDYKSNDVVFMFLGKGVKKVFTVFSTDGTAENPRVLITRTGNIMEGSLTGEISASVVSEADLQDFHQTLIATYDALRYAGRLGPEERESLEDIVKKAKEYDYSNVRTIAAGQEITPSFLHLRDKIETMKIFADPTSVGSARIEYLAPGAKDIAIYTIATKTRRGIDKSTLTVQHKDWNEFMSDLPPKHQDFPPLEVDMLPEEARAAIAQIATWAKDGDIDAKEKPLVRQEIAKLRGLIPR